MFFITAKEALTCLDSKSNYVHSLVCRKHIEGMPIVFDENEESDTALSQLQSSSQPKSVVSF